VAQAGNAATDSTMKRNGSLIAHGRKWPLYETPRWVRGVGAVVKLFLDPQHRAELERLDRQALKHGRQVN
jgi:hypothetical protein